MSGADLLCTQMLLKDCIIVLGGELYMLITFAFHVRTLVHYSSYMVTTVQIPTVVYIHHTKL